MELRAGFWDRQLAEKCLGEQYNINQIITTAITRETSKASAEVVKVQETTTLKQVASEVGFEVRIQKIVKEGCKETVRRMQKGRFSSMAKTTYPNALLTMKKRLTIQLKEKSACAVV